MPSAGTGQSSGGSSQPSLWTAPTAVPHAPVGSAAGPTAAPTLTDVGSFGVDVSSPQGLGASAAKDAQQSGNLIEGLTSALFGVHGQGGVPIISDIAHGVGYATSFLQPGTPIGDSPIGAVAQAVGKIPGAIGTMGAGALDVAGGALEHVPSLGNIFSGGANDKQLAAQFAAMPDGPAKQQVEADIAAGKAPAGHLMDNYIRANIPEAQKVNPSLFPESQVAPSSFADDLSNLFGLLGSTVRLIERPVAGAAKLSTGLDRLQEIEAVHNGAQYTGTFGSGAFSGSIDGSGHSGNTPAEELAYQKWKDQSWTKDQALDYLTAAGAGWSHDPGLEMAGQIALDPQVFGSVGAAALSKLGVAGLKLVAAASQAEKIAAETETAAKVIVGARGTFLRGALISNPQIAGVVRALGEHVYAPIANNALGQSAKVMRTIVDPLHAIGGNKIVGEATVDLASGAAPKVMAAAHGPLAATKVLEWAKATLPPEVADKLIAGVSTYSANVTRQVLMQYHQATMMVANLGRALIGRNPGEMLSSLLSHAPSDWADLVKTQMTAVRKLGWNDAAVANLGDRYAAFHGGMTAEEYTAEFAKMDPNMLGYLHAVSYGTATGDFLDAIGKGTRAIGKAAADALKLPRLILMNEQTLSDVKGQAILDLLKAAADAPEAATTIRAAQKMYPELAYLELDPKNLSSSVERFIRNLTQQLSDGELPAQVRPEHLAKMPQEVQDVAAKIHGAWDLGFRPSDELMSGLKTDGEGMLVPGRIPWPDHVAVSNPAYRGTWAMAHNIAGMPIAGSYVGKAIDYMEAGAQALFSNVSSNVISAAARTRFVTAATLKHPELTAQEAQAIYRAVEDVAGIHKIAVRGLSATDMWTASKALIPDSLALTGKMTQRDLMTMMVDAYEGDLRFVGLTQKFTGRVKSWLAATTGSNFAGQFSENLYQKIRFKYNPIFQVQERIEGWVLASQRGAMAALGVKYTEADRRAALVYDALNRTGLVRASNMDIAEQAAQTLAGSTMEQELNRFVGQGRLATLLDVAGSKRLNELRVFEHNMGKIMRSAMDKGAPGTWDDIVAHYSAVAGHLVSDDEAAVRRITEGALGGDIRVSNLLEPGANFADFKNAISPQQWHIASNIGEVKSLDLDFMTKTLGFTLKDGTEIKTIKQLRAALADPSREITIERVTKAMQDVLSPDPDYVRRVQNALDFHWNDFWRSVGEKYNMSTPEVLRWQRMFQDAAAARHMTPVDYVSQVWSPGIKGGKDAIIAEIGKGVSILRAPTEGASEVDLIRNMVSVFRSHLDPSAQETLIKHFGAEGGLDLPASAMPDVGTYSTTAGGFRRGQYVTDTQHQAITARGQTLLDSLSAEPRPLTYLDNSAEEARTRLFDAVQKTDGGLTLDPETGKALTAEPWMHHGTTEANTASIAQSGIQRGDWVANAADPLIPRASNVLYRTHPSAFEGGVEKAPGWHSNPRVGVGDLQISRDKGKTWEPAAAGQGREGPFASSIGVQTDMPIADAADPAKFQAKYSEFMAANRAELAKKEHYVGVFRNEETQQVEFDVSVIAQTRADAEALQAAANVPQTGGAYNVWNGEDNAFAPVNMGDWTAAHTQQFTQAVIDRIKSGKPPLSVKATAAQGKAIQDAYDAAATAKAAGAANAEELLAKAQQLQKDTMGGVPGFGVPPINPDVERAVRQFSKWSKETLSLGLADKPGYASVLKDVTGIPTDGAVPFNEIHQLMVNQIGHAMRQGSEDAFRLQYFARNRSFIERSINHPFFGIYPASYMWGKILPELVKFVAQSPFGIRTGAMAYAGTDIAKALAIQLEYDPNFQKLLDGAGRSQIFWMLGYLLPALPWDVGAAAPTWARDLAAQGLDNQLRVDQGLAAKPIDLTSPLKRIGDYISPFRSVTQTERVVKEVQNTLWPAPAATTGVPQVQAAAPAGAAQAAAPTGPTQATELGPVLADSMAQLQAILAGQG